MEKHSLIPKHTKLSDKERDKLLESLGITISELPKILKTDPAIISFEPKRGDVIKIERSSVTAGEITFYRRVTDA